LWSLRDHPDLVLRVAELPAIGSEALVPQEAMRDFLQEFGPLTWSTLIGPTNDNPDLLLASKQLAGIDGDPRSSRWAFEFSRPVAIIRAAVAQIASGEASIADCLRVIDETPQRSLLRGISMQLLQLAIDDLPPRRCAGCGRLFTRTEDPSEGRHRRAWKRRDAKYHSARRRKAHLERRRRKRLADASRESV